MAAAPAAPRARFELPGRLGAVRRVAGPRGRRRVAQAVVGGHHQRRLLCLAVFHGVARNRRRQAGHGPEVVHHVHRRVGVGRARAAGHAPGGRARPVVGDRAGRQVRRVVEVDDGLTVGRVDRCERGERAGAPGLDQLRRIRDARCRAQSRLRGLLRAGDRGQHSGEDEQRSEANDGIGHREVPHGAGLGTQARRGGRYAFAAANSRPTVSSSAFVARMPSGSLSVSPSYSMPT